MEDIKNVKIDLVKEGIERVKETLKAFFEGEFDSVTVRNITPETFQQCLESCNVDINQDTDFNGWQCDYCYTCTLEEQVYQVHGGAWYGHANIEKADD